MNILNALGYGGQMMAIGMVVVFLGLIILIICISIMAAIFKKINKNKAQKAETAAPAAPVAEAPVVKEAPEADEGTIDPQVIAVISAAIAAFDQSGRSLVVRKVRRVNGWKDSARQEQVYRF